MEYFFFEQWITDTVTNLSDFKVLLLVILSYAGSVYVILPLAIFFWTQINDQVRQFLFTILCGYSVFIILKPVFDYTRPSVTIPTTFSETAFAPVVNHALREGTGTFPSGHAVVTTVFLLAVIYEFNLYKHPIAVLGTVSYLSVIGFSRVLLGVHYPIDIIAGVVIGATTFVIMYNLYEYNTIVYHSILASLLVLAIFSPRAVDGVLLLIGYVGIYIITTSVVNKQKNAFVAKTKRYLRSLS